MANWLPFAVLAFAASPHACPEQRGQQFATLTGELSRPSSEGSGVAEFDAVTVTGATSPIVCVALRLQVPRAYSHTFLS